jgi:hypothetical protein
MCRANRNRASQGNVNQLNIIGLFNKLAKYRKLVNLDQEQIRAIFKVQERLIARTARLKTFRRFST